MTRAHGVQERYATNPTASAAQQTSQGAAADAAASRSTTIPAKAGTGSISTGLAQDLAHAAAQSTNPPMSDQVLREEVQKRLTLNWLIQGAAQHARMTFHHLVRDELNALDPRLLRLYDQYALINLLQYWQPEAAMLFGWPPRF